MAIKSKNPSTELGHILHVFKGIAAFTGFAA
jgi:hypothetical protein